MFPHASLTHTNPKALNHLPCSLLRRFWTTTRRNYIKSNFLYVRWQEKKIGKRRNESYFDQHDSHSVKRTRVSRRNHWPRDTVVLPHQRWDDHYDALLTLPLICPVEVLSDQTNAGITLEISHRCGSHYMHCARRGLRHLGSAEEIRGVTAAEEQTGKWSPRAWNCSLSSRCAAIIYGKGGEPKEERREREVWKGASSSCWGCCEGTENRRVFSEAISVWKGRSKQKTFGAVLVSNDVSLSKTFNGSISSIKSKLE